MTVQDGNRPKGQGWRSMLPCYAVALGLFISLALVPTQALALATFVVDLGGFGCSDETGAFRPFTHPTVVSGVDAAIADLDPMVEVLICPGTYVGDVTVDDTPAPPLAQPKTVTIRGLGFTPSSPGPPPPILDKTLVRINGTAGSAGPIINVVSAAQVDISNLTVDGLSSMTPAVGPSPPADTAVGIQYGLVPGTISNVMVQNIRDLLVPSLVQGIGINLMGQTLAAMMLAPPEVMINIRQCMVMNVTRVGIRADGRGINVDVQQCSVTGPSAIAMDPGLTHAPNGLQVSRGAKGTASNNEFLNFRSPTPEAGAGSGMVFLCPAVDSGLFAAAMHNTVRNADLGVALVDSDGVRVASNTIIDAEIGITMQAQGSLFDDPFCFPPHRPTQNSQILSNIILDATEAGVQSTAFTFDPGNIILGQRPQLNNIEDNSIFTDATTAMAPIAVSSGQNNNFVENIIIGGLTSRIVDTTEAVPGATGTAGTQNTYANFCFGITINAFCNPLTSVTSKTETIPIDFNLPASPL